MNLRDIYDCFKSMKLYNYIDVSVVVFFATFTFMILPSVL